MNKLTLSFLIVAFSIVASFGSEIKLNGIYQGENIFVMNPFASSGVGFCVYEVRINGEMSTDEINSSAFEIDLSLYSLTLGDKISIIIKHKDNCTPKILNPEVLKPKSTYKLGKIAIDQNGTITWTTTNEAGALDFIVEQYRWNKWVRVGKIKGKGTPKANNYSVKTNAHSGQNKYRIKQIDYTKKANYSKDVLLRSMKQPVTTNAKGRVKDKITFSEATMWEIYDNYGNRKLNGISNEVDVSKLEKGTYFLNFDNQMIDFKK